MAEPTDTQDTRARDALAFACVWIPHALLVGRAWFVADDAFISFRYARNWARGLGLVFNPSDPPVEGYSNFLLVCAAALMERLGLDMRFGVPLLTASCASLLLLLVFARLRGRLGVPLLPATLAAALLGWSAPFAAWATSGLETMLYALLFAAALDRLLLARSPRAGLAAGALALALALTRAEGIQWAALVLPGLGALALVLRGRADGAPRPGPTLARYGLVLAPAFALYFAWRWQLFGRLLPATVTAKVGFSLARAGRGLDYLAVQVLTSPWLLVALAALPAALRARRRAVGLPAALVPLGTALYAVLVGGDWMTFGRFLVPALPFAAVLAAWLLEDVARGAGRAAAGALGAALVALAVLPGFDVHVVPEPARARHHFRLNRPDYRSEHDQWLYQRDEGVRWTALGRALRALGPPDATLVTGAIGAVGFESDLAVLDRHGFVTPAVLERAHGDADGDLRSPGHDGVVEERWFVDQGFEPTWLRAKLEGPGTREELARELVGSARRLRGLGLAETYAPDFVALGDGDDPAWLVVLWRRLRPGESSADAWREHAERAELLRSGGPVRTIGVPAPTGAIPGLPPGN